MIESSFFLNYFSVESSLAKSIFNFHYRDLFSHFNHHRLKKISFMNRLSLRITSRHTCPKLKITNSIKTSLVELVYVFGTLRVHQERIARKLNKNNDSKASKLNDLSNCSRNGGRRVLQPSEIVNFHFQSRSQFMVNCGCEARFFLLLLRSITQSSFSS